MSTARAALLTLALGACACGSPPAAPAPAVRATVTTVALPAQAAATTVTVPADAGQVVMRLGGALGDVDQLTAEVTPTATPDDARRWPVDAAPESGDGATASVTLPAYALPPGAYTATVWEGDAKVVQQYRFTVAR